jgi:hypothetical protein
LTNEWIIDQLPNISLPADHSRTYVSMSCFKRSLNQKNQCLAYCENYVFYLKLLKRICFFQVFQVLVKVFVIYRQFPERLAKHCWVELLWVTDTIVYDCAQMLTLCLASTFYQVNDLFLLLSRDFYYFFEFCLSLAGFTVFLVSIN